MNAITTEQIIDNLSFTLGEWEKLRQLLASQQAYAVGAKALAINLLIHHGHTVREARALVDAVPNAPHQETPAR